MINKIALDILMSRSFMKLILKQGELSNSDIYYVQVDPREISHYSLIPEYSSSLYGPHAFHGSYKGCFDLVKKSFERHYIYKTVHQIRNGTAWESTPYFKKLLKRNERGMALSQLKKLEKLIDILGTKGYLSQYQMGKANISQAIYKWKVPLHEIIIAMDRNGRFFRIKGGRHRLAVAQNIGIHKMPAVLSLYHQDAQHLLPEQRRIIAGDIKDFRPF